MSSCSCPDQTLCFLDLPYRPARDCRYHIISVPYEDNVSYGGGTSLGPAAILEASCHLEEWDGKSTPGDDGIFTGPTIGCEGSPEAVLGRIERAVSAALDLDNCPVLLGGEHTITLGALRALARRHKHLGQDKFGVVQFDAHGDLRNTYEDTPYSHGCVMRRACDLELPLMQVAVRSLSLEEVDFRKSYGVHHLDAAEFSRLGGLTAASRPEFKLLPGDFPQDIYVTFDIDALDASLMPATGTPDPGGLSWYEALRLLKLAVQGRRVIGLDFVEVAPIPNYHAAEFTAAKLLYYFMGIIQRHALR
jgi:agmatinase